MQPIQSLAHTVLAQVLRGVPFSGDKLLCAWRLAVGPDLARVSRVAVEDGAVVARVEDDRWYEELARSRDLIAARLRSVLGADVARTFRLEAPASHARRRTRRQSVARHLPATGRPAQEEES